MQFNSAKCKFMLVSRSSRRNNTTPSQPSCLNGSPLESVPTFKYLGVLLSSDLTWSKHVQSIRSRARKLIGLLYRQYQSFHSPRPVLLQQPFSHTASFHHSFADSVHTWNCLPQEVVMAPSLNSFKTSVGVFIFSFVLYLCYNT